MQQHRRLYPARGQNQRSICFFLLLISAGLIISGFLSHLNPDPFGIEPVPMETAVPLNASFDETIASAEMELSPKHWYALQTGAFEVSESALEAAKVFEKRGAAGYIWHEGRYRVLASVYPTMDEAQRVREQLQTRHSIDTYVYTIEMPALKLRVKGMQGQIDILQAAFAHADDLAVQLQRLSVELDRQEKSIAEVQKETEALGQQLRLVALRLKQRFAHPLPKTVEILLGCFEDYSEYASSVGESQSVFEAGIELKKQTFEVLWNLKQVYQLLSAT